MHLKGDILNIKSITFNKILIMFWYKNHAHAAARDALRVRFIPRACQIVGYRADAVAEFLTQRDVLESVCKIQHFQ